MATTLQSDLEVDNGSFITITVEGEGRGWHITVLDGRTRVVSEELGCISTSVG